MPGLTRLTALAAMVLFQAGQVSAVEEHTLKCIADAPMYGHPEEADFNWGAAQRMRIKDYQGIPFLQFDFKSLRGKRAVSCTLHVRAVEGQSAFCTDIISTIAVPWYEGHSNGSAETGASCFTRCVWPDSLWAGLESDARNVINGDNGSIVNSRNLCFPANGGWAQADLDTLLVQQLLDGEGYGIALFGKDIQYNRDIYSRESVNNEPYLTIKVEEGEKVPPAAVKDLSASEAIYHGKFTLRWTAPGDDSTRGIAAAYEFRYSESPISDLTAWDKALVLPGAPAPDSSGKIQSWTVTFLEPGKTYFLALRARDKAWNWSDLSNMITVRVPLDNIAPSAVSNLSARPGTGGGEVILSWTAPGDDGTSGQALSYELRYALEPTSDSNWDKATVYPILLKPDSAGSAQSYLVAGLAPGTIYYFALRALDEVPLSGPVSNSPSGTASSGDYNLWAAPSYYKINPRTGGAFEYDEKNYDVPAASAPYRAYNRIWDAAKGKINLLAGRNEFVGCQLIIEKTGQDILKGIDVSVSYLKGPGIISSAGIKLYREWYHRFNGIMYPDLLVPFQADSGSFQAHPFDIPDKQIATFAGIEQNNQVVFLDIYIPHRVPAGTYQATITVSGQGKSNRLLSLEVEVLDFELSDSIHYAPEFNCYNDIGQGWKIDHTWTTVALHDSLEKVVQRTLHEHRIYLDRMPYYHNPSTQAAFRCAPDLSSGTGSALTITGWTEYDKRFGPYFDGTAFKDNPRAGVPIHFYYLPFHTEWPVRMPLPRGPSVFKDQNYIDGWTKIVTEFEKHINEKGWSRTNFFCYQNEKEHFGYQPWDLDEPTRLGDYEALNFFAGMYHRSLRHDGPAKMIYRCDMGHFSYMKGELDNTVDIWVINTGDYPENKVRERIATGKIAWTYGAAPFIYENMAGNYQIHFSNWSKGARGYCYWDTFQAWSGNAWMDNNQGDTNLFYPGWAGYTNMIGHMVCPSLRMKAIRDATEIMEALYILAHSTGYSVEKSEAFAREYNTGQIESYAQAEEDLKHLLDGLPRAPSELPGGPGKSCDYSGDGYVSIYDVFVFLLLGRDEPERPEMDWNGDGSYSILDAVRLLLDILNGSCPGETTTILAGERQKVRARKTELTAEDINYLQRQIGLMILNAREKELLYSALQNLELSPSLPRAFSLLQNAPNPFNPSTVITYTIPEGQQLKVKLEVFNLRGTIVRTLVDEERAAGSYHVMWDGTDEERKIMGSGVYFYRLRAGNYTAVRKMVLVK